ncbi:MAG TPA: protein-glutamate O-methyltransferase [Gemmatimonadaceae bacterium]|jgi:chemotaxis protein methyltransferase CheR|nr:protein-glutamate O-methyltransferase [Gemmatimonadota bacterium]MBK9407480.1 protein-glutamate O-methyltransferase [Gemmatimonadota bacterium]HNV73911.1 protein-glutamate O-methyltransferase [Gemmatimonadaceae bacterium]
MTAPSVGSIGGIDLTDAQFRRVGELVGRISGIQLPPGKESLVRSRLAKRLRALGLASVTEYLEIVEREPSRAELAEMVDVLTTNKTSFFREVDHFRLLESTVLPALGGKGAPIRIWSAGCSSGEEPYTVAMVARETLGAAASRVRILATDISARVLARAREGLYDADTLDDVPPALRRTHFEPVANATDRLRVAPATRDLVQFARLNLMGDWPMKGPFDVILCRNVMIYFDKPTQERLVSRYASLLAPGGYLFVGHSESLSGLRHELAYVQPATYRKGR